MLMGWERTFEIRSTTHWARGETSPGMTPQLSAGYGSSGLGLLLMTVFLAYVFLVLIPTSA